MNMFKIILIAVAMLSFSVSNAAPPENPDILKGHSDGNGGGTIYRNGQYISLYDAGFYAEPLSLKQNEVPQLNNLISFIKHSDFLSNEWKAGIINKLISSSNRKYYNVQKDSFDDATKISITNKYREALDVRPENFKIAAITDPKTKSTYLFPEFYALKPSSQKAILYHESLWLHFRSGTIATPDHYKWVTKREVAMEALINKPYSADAIINFLNIHEVGAAKMIIAAINYDERNQTLPNALSNNKISLSALYGENWVQCVSKRSTPSSCISIAGLHLIDLHEKLPNSMLVKVLVAEQEKRKTLPFEFWVVAETGDSSTHVVNLFNLSSRSITREIREKINNSGCSLESIARNIKISTEEPNYNNFGLQLSPHGFTRHRGINGFLYETQIPPQCENVFNDYSIVKQGL